jgi:hypothetical protein
MPNYIIPTDAEKFRLFLKTKTSYPDDRALNRVILKTAFAIVARDAINLFNAGTDDMYTIAETIVAAYFD